MPKPEIDRNSVSKLRVMHYDPWLTADGPALLALVDDIFASMSPSDITPGRKRRADAEARRKLCMTALAANLVVAALSPARFDGVAVPLRNLKLSRYDRAEFNADVLRAAIRQFHGAGLATVQDAVFREKRTVITPSPCLRELIVKAKVKIGDVRHVQGRETIELWAGSTRGRDKRLVDYVDDPKTDHLRNEMTVINRMLNTGDIRLGGVGVGPVHVVRIFRAEKPNGHPKFNRHGRLYGGFWEGLPKDRRYLLTVRGEPVVDLDFASMFIQLAYCREGILAPEGNLYAIPGLEEHRTSVKRLMVSLFFREGEAKRLPSGTKDDLPRGWTMERFKASASAFHPAIAHLFDTDVGFELMGMESELLVGILLGLSSNDIAALPMHDGIMVGTSNKEFAIEMMQKMSQTKLGRELQVVEKAFPQPLK